MSAPAPPVTTSPPRPRLKVSLAAVPVQWSPLLSEVKVWPVAEPPTLITSPVWVRPEADTPSIVSTSHQPLLWPEVAYRAQTRAPDAESVTFEQLVTPARLALPPTSKLRNTVVPWPCAAQYCKRCNIICRVRPVLYDYESMNRLMTGTLRSFLHL